MNLFWNSLEGYYPSIYQPAYQHAGKVIWFLLVFVILGNITILNYLGRHTHKSDKSTIESSGVYDVTSEFLISRSDILSREIHYLRSGTSIIAGIFTGVTVILWDPKRILEQVEVNVIALFSILVFFCVISILLSFGNAKASYQGYELEGHLIPGKYSDTIYKKLLRGTVELKQYRLERMTSALMAGLMLFLLLSSFIVMGIYLNPIQSYANHFPLEYNGLITGLVFLILLFPSAVMIEMGWSGIMVLDDSEEENYKKETENSEDHSDL